MPIVFEPLQRMALLNVLDPLGLTLVIREETGGDDEDEETWGSYMLVNGVEYDLYEAWGAYQGDTSEEALENVADAMSNRRLTIGSVVVDCLEFVIVVGDAAAKLTSKEPS